MFITKEEIRNELKDEECFKKGLSANEKAMFLIYCTNGLEELQAFKDVYCNPDSTRTIRFPGKKAAEIVAKDAFQECFDGYYELLAEVSPSKVNAQIFNVLYNQAFYSVFDFIDANGEFLYADEKEAKAKLGAKAVAIESITTTMHPKDPDKLIRKVNFESRSKALKEIAKWTKFLGEEVGGGPAMPNINIDLGSNNDFNPRDEEEQMRELGIVKK